MTRMALVITANILLASGCATQYQLPEHTEATSIIHFEREVEDPLLGSGTVFLKLDDEYQCNDLFKGQENLTRIESGILGSPDDHPTSVVVASEKNFRLLARTQAGYSACGNIISFETQPDKSYLILVKAKIKSAYNQPTCSIKLFEQNEKDKSKSKEVIITDYQQC